ncbi:MAG TPA: hypothetical protein DIT75_04340 [Rikenellaceae bacterium]|nr:hypothetical protein [Rikenellaceae bacterium]
MKRLVIIAVSIIMASSCSILHHAEIDNPAESHFLTSDSKVSLNVSPQRITYVYRPSSDDAKSLGVEQLKRNAVYEALESNGGYDVLVGINYFITAKHGLFCKQVTSIKLSGYPATYKNFRDAPENVVSIDGATVQLDMSK